MTNDLSGVAPGPARAMIAADLERRIADGEYPAGRQLPSEQALAGGYATTRARVRTALASLARRGLIVSRPGSGWVVQAGRQAQTVGEMRAFSQWAAEHGHDYGGRIVHREHGSATAREAALLGIGLDAEVLRFTRVRTLDGRPVLVERSTWGTWVVPVVSELPDDVPSIFSALADAGVRVMLGDHRFEAAAASSEDRSLLGVRRSSPLLQVSRETTARDGRAVEAAVDRYVPGFAAFEVHAADVTRAMLAP